MGLPPHLHAIRRIAGSGSPEKMPAKSELAGADHCTCGQPGPAGVLWTKSGQ
jgi:hypothetical protein